MPQDLVCVDSHVPGNPHFSVFYNCQGLTDISSVSTIQADPGVFPAHLPEYPQGQLVVALLILILDKLLAFIDNVPHCFSGFPTHHLLDRACS